MSASLTETSPPNAAACGSDTVTYDHAYDAMGRRAAKRVDAGYGWSVWHWYFYDGLKVVAEGTGTADRTFFTLGPGDVGGIIARDDDGTKYWYHYDRLGNVLGVTDANGDVAQVYQLDCFGVLRQAYGSSGYNSTESPVQRYGLTTKERDPDTGLYYFNARWYYPWWGRFLSRAPLPVEEEHPYTYVENRPTAAVDPSGRKHWLFGAGHLCMQDTCTEEGTTGYYYMAEDWSTGDELPPVPCGQKTTRRRKWKKFHCVEVDALYAPSGFWPGSILKIPDSKACYVYCDKDGCPTLIECGGNDLRSEQWFPWDSPPPGWPDYDGI